MKIRKEAMVEEIRELVNKINKNKHNCIYFVSDLEIFLKKVNRLEATEVDYLQAYFTKEVVVSIIEGKG